MSSEINPLDSNTKNVETFTTGYILLAILLFIATLIVINNFPKADEYSYGADEGIYLSQATAIKDSGIGGIKKLVEEYISKPEKHLFPPPLRVAHIYTLGILFSLKGSISIFSYYSLFCFLLTGVISFIFVRKFWGDKIALITSCFMIFSPINIGLARRALMDSPYTLFTVLSLTLFINFINLRTNKNYLYFILSFTWLLLYKETTCFYIPFFVLVLLIVKYFVDRSLEFSYIVKTALIPPSVVFTIYLFTFGSLENIITVFKGLFLPNFLVPLRYAVDYCSGPWHHYLVDYFIVMPIISLLFFMYVGYYFINTKKNINMSLLMAFMVYFLIVFALFFKNIRYAMILNFVYALSAALMLVHLIEILLSSKQINKYLGTSTNLQKALIIFSVSLISISGIYTQDKLFIKNNVYDPVLFELLRSEKMIPSIYGTAEETVTEQTVTKPSEEIAFLQEISKLAAIALENPTEANYLNLSLNYYQARLYSEAIKMAEKALTLNPKSVNAYNNICASYIFLAEYDKAIEAANKALDINPEFQLTKNNLNWAKDAKAKAIK